MNRVEPAHVPGCFKMFKMFKTTGTHREEPGRLSNTVINREDAGVLHRDGVGAVPVQSGEHPCLHRDKPCGSTAYVYVIKCKIKMKSHSCYP